MQITHGSNHIRYITRETTYRLTTDAPIDYVRNETLFNLEDPINIVFGPDETLSEGVNNIARLLRFCRISPVPRWNGSRIACATMSGGR